MFEHFKVEKRLTTVEIDVAELQRRVTSLEIQWGDTLDRIKTMMSRLTKQQRRQEAAELTEPEHLTDEEVADGHMNLSQRAQEINNRILARRNRSPQQ